MPPELVKNLSKRLSVIESSLADHLIESGTIKTKLEFLETGFKWLVGGLFSFTGSILLAVIVYLLNR